MLPATDEHNEDQARHHGSECCDQPHLERHNGHALSAPQTTSAILRPTTAGLTHYRAPGRRRITARKMKKPRKIAARLRLWSRSGFWTLSRWRGLSMSKFIRRVAGVVAVALAPMAYVTVVSPGVSSAQCDWGDWWDPIANVCRPIVPPAPQDCGWGNWWDPGTNVCRPVIPPAPQDCGWGNWWDPGANVCRPVVP